MSTTASATIIVWASTDRGDIPTRALTYGDVPAIIADALRQDCVGTVAVEIDDIEVARGDAGNTEDLDDYLAALTA